MHHNPAKNVLFADKTSAEIAKETGWPVEKVESLLASGLEKLRAARAKRPAPFVDRTMYANWNAMYARAYLDAWRYLGREDCRDFALKTLRLLWKNLWDRDAGMYHQWANGVRRITGLLEDHVWLAAALLEAFEADGDPDWRENAVEVMRVALERYWDPKGGGFFDLAKDSVRDAASVLALKRKPVEDSPSPSSNGVAAGVLPQLHHLTGGGEDRAPPDELIRAFAGGAPPPGAGFRGADFRAAE